MFLKTAPFLRATLISILVRLTRSMGFPLCNFCNATDIYSAHHPEPRSVYEKQPDLDEMHNDSIDCIF